VAVRENWPKVIIVDGGPTGVELAGAIKEIAVKTLADDFRNIDTTTTPVILIEGTDRLLPSFDPALSARAEASLRKMGIEVMTQSTVTHIDANGLRIGSEFIPAKNIFWAAGVQANPLAALPGVPLDRAGRVLVERDLSVPGHPNVFVAGDMAAVTDAGTNKPVPGVAPAALQMSRHIARLIKRESESGILGPGDREAFRYRDKGSLATIGKSRAVAQVGGWRLSGFVAWLLWGLVHIFFLIGFRNRLIVTSKWFWNWLIGARDARLITGDNRVSPPRRDLQARRASE
jgi:NADH:ubiquinone reductase (H+-translocating)